MNLFSQQPPWSLFFASAFAASGWLMCDRVAAQGARDTPAESAKSPIRSAKDRVKVQPYSGLPIYLDQREEVAPPTLVTHETLTEKYEELDTPRTERQLARYSDNHYEADGFYREFYPNGKPFVVGEFRRGRQHGEWTYSYDNGQLNRKAIYKDGLPEGTWEVYRADGTLSAKRGFKEGQRDGAWITYDSTGEKPLSESHYVSGKADGVWKVWYPDGSQLRQQLSFKDGKLDGVSAEWTEKGEKGGEVSYADGKRDGTSTVWLPDGSKVVQQYKAGKLVSEKKE